MLLRTHAKDILRSRLSIRLTQTLDLKFSKNVSCSFNKEGLVWFHCSDTGAVINMDKWQVNSTTLLCYCVYMLRTALDLSASLSETLDLQGWDKELFSKWNQRSSTRHLATWMLGHVHDLQMKNANNLSLLWVFLAKNLIHSLERFAVCFFVLSCSPSVPLYLYPTRDRLFITLTAG